MADTKKKSAKKVTKTAAKKVERRAIKAGEKFEGSFGGKIYTMTAEKSKEGDGLIFRVSGKAFRTPSAASAFVRNGRHGGSWKFWNMDHEERKPRVAKAKTEKKATVKKTAKKSAVKKTVKKNKKTEAPAAESAAAAETAVPEQAAA